LIPTFTVTAAITANPLGIAVAFGAGVISFLSPCVLPLVPGYISVVSGLSAAELKSGRDGRGALSNGSLLRQIASFVAGFTVVFVALGAAASGLGQLLGAHKTALTSVAGVLIVVFGVMLLVSTLPSGVWSKLGPRPASGAARLMRERRFFVKPSSLGAWTAPVMGAAFAFAWTPCIGPVLGAVLGLASLKSSLADGVVLLFAYSLGLGVPFLVTGLAFGRLTSLIARARSRVWVVNLAGGVVMVVFGSLLIAGQLGWLSAQFAGLLNLVGLHRLTTS
jgi:cytochrome c-type biogenesis protein